MKIKLKNVSKGWFSLATKNGARIELKVNAIEILDILEEHLNYYKQFIPLGIVVEVLKEAEPKKEVEPIEDITLINNHIDEVVAEEVKNDDINKIDPGFESLVGDDLKSLKKDQLKELCDSLGVKYPKGVRKNELIDLLLKEYGE